MKATFLVFLCILKSISCDSNTRIVGGRRAPDGKAPYICSIQRDGRHYCAGSIISQNWIITAGHCMSDKDLAYMKIRVGSNNRISGGQMYDLQRKIIHPEYVQSSNNVVNDIALAQVRGSIQFNNKVKAINLGQREVPAGTALYVAGWGRFNWGEISPDELQELTIRAVSHQDCKKRWPKINDGVLCTLNKVGEGTCLGDSGGPLVWGNDLVGIVSFGDPCAVGSPDAFTKVSYYYNWIKSNAN